MTATQFGGEREPGRHPLAPGASPSSIRHALLLEDRAAFDAEYAAALDAARDSLDLTGLFDMLERWRRVAVLQADRGRFERVVRRAAELRTGKPVPREEPFSITRANAGL